MTAVAASASGRKGGAGGDDAGNNTGNATTAPSAARPPLVRRSSGSAGSAPGGGGSPNHGPQVETPQAPPGPQQHRSTPSASTDLPPLHPTAASTNAAGVPLVRQISDASAQQQRAAGATHHRSNQPSVDTAAGNETLGNETLDSAYIATALAESTSAIRQTHGIAFHDDDSSMGSVVFHYGLGSTPPNDGDYDLPPRNIAGNRGRAGTAGTVDSGLTADGVLDRSNHRLTLTANNAAGNGISSGNVTPNLQEHKQMPFRQYLPGGTHQHQTSQPPQEHQHQKRWGSEMGIKQTPSADYVERGKSSSLTSSGNGSEGVGANGDDEADINDDRVLPYNVRLSQREGGPQVPPPLPPPPPTANMSPVRKPPLSPAKTRGAVTIPKTPPSDFSSLSASTYTTLGTRSGGGLRGMEYAELPGDRSPATMTSGADVPPIPGLGVDGRSDVPPSNVPKMKHPRSPLSRKRRDGASAGHGGWFNKLAHKMRGGGTKSNTTGSYGSIEDPALAKEAKRYHDKNQAFLKRTEWHRKMQRSGNMEQAAVMAAGSNHSRTKTDFSGALDSIASISSEEITDEEERGRDVRHETQPLVAESKEEEYLRRIRELEDENRRLLRVQAMEAEVHGYSAGYGTLPTAIPITVNVDRTKNDDNARKARVARETKTLHGNVWKRIVRFLVLAETFFSNLPLTICAMAMSWVTLGVVYFKFYEELSSCVPKHFHSLACTFPEFPGCFECRDDSEWYRIAVGFHYTCSSISGLMIVSVLIKFIVAGRVILDDLENPTSSAPYGLLFMASACVFAGRGLFGKVVVMCTGGLHLLLTLWFMYSVRAYKSLPDPSFFPNTIGIGYPAVKLWLYYPYPGLFLMAVSLVSLITLFPMSLFRVWTVDKISAPVCWIQISGPSIVLYTLTLLAQPPSYAVESNLDPEQFLLVHRKFYLPCMHTMAVLSVVGVFSSVLGICKRWETIVNKPFSPAHAAFVFPCLSHANAIQAYRGAVDAFSTIPPGSAFKKILFCYWMVFLVGGTIVCFVFSIKFFRRLPMWTLFQVEEADKEPPAPNETHIADVVSIGERWRNQKYKSPAILQANETGGLVRRRRGTQDGRGDFVRTRNLTALGFDPALSLAELENEIEILLAEVERNPPRQRRGWHSAIPGIDFGSDLASLGSGSRGRRQRVFDGLFDALSLGSNGGNRNSRRSRAQSEDVRQGQNRRGHGRQDTNDSDLMHAWG